MRADPQSGLGRPGRQSPHDRIKRVGRAMMDGRRLLEIIVVIVGLAILFGTLVWFSWAMSNFGDPL